jgi:hypothetical protein
VQVEKAGYGGAHGMRQIFMWRNQSHVRQAVVGHGGSFFYQF